jgi:hypothetical protein
MQIEPLRDVIVASVHARNELYAIDPADPGRSIFRLHSAGAKPKLQPCAALEYAPNCARLIYFSPLDGGVLYSVAANKAGSSHDKFAGTWTWHACVPGAGTLEPIGDAARHSRLPVNLAHAFGRFRIAAFGAIDLAILVRHVDSPVYAMRLN